MKRSNQFAEFISNPPGGWQGVLVTQTIGLTINLLAGIISIQTDNIAWLLWLWVFSLLLFVWVIYLTWRRTKPKSLVPENQKPKKHRGLILLVGKGRPNEAPMKQSAGKAIDYHLSNRPGQGLKVCWLIASEGEVGSWEYALKYQEICASQGVKTYVHGVRDPYGNIQETYDLVNKIYAQELAVENLSENDVIADFTGGTKPMSAGMILACGEQRKMQYMYGHKETVSSEPRLMEFRA